MADDKLTANVRPPSHLRRDRSRSSSKLKWNNINENSKSSSLKGTDYEPAFALRKIALLYEKNENDQVAQLLKGISLSTLRKIYQQFPIDMFIEGIPQTLTIVNTLYSRLLSSSQLNGFQVDLPFTSLLLQIVKLQARNLATDLPKLKGWERHNEQCDNLLQVIGRTEGVSSLKLLRSRQRRLARALGGMDEHGMIEVETSLIDSEEISNQLMPLPLALRVELERMTNNCKISTNKLTRESRKISFMNSEHHITPSAAAKLNILAGLPDHKNHKNDKRSLEDEFFECNHQRMLNFTSSSIQDRLYKNKALLNIVEPTMNYAQLPKLVDMLQKRIEKDKEILSTFYDLRKDMISISSEARLLPTIHQYDEAFTNVINTLKHYVPDDTGTPEASVTSSTAGSYVTSTTVNKSSKPSSDYMSFDGSTEVGEWSKSDVSSQGFSPTSSNSAHGRKSNEELKNECENLREQLNDAKRKIEKLKLQEQTILKRLPQLTQERSRSATPNGLPTNNKQTNNKPTNNKHTSSLGKSFLNLYNQQSLGVLDRLEQTWASKESETIIKSKILFSIIVVSFRSAMDTYDRLRYQLRNMICASRSPHEDDVINVETTFTNFLRSSTDTYDVTANVQSVTEQIFDALYDHPRLRTSEPLKSYIRECVRLSWSLAVHVPALGLDYDSELFDPCVHRRFSTSDTNSDNIVCFLWPALLERETGRCVTHGLVITG